MHNSLLRLKSLAKTVINSPIILRIRRNYFVAGAAFFLARLVLRKAVKFDSAEFELKISGDTWQSIKLVASLRKKPRLSVLMTVYNPDVKLLAKCIDSVLGQVYLKWELCLVDNVSTRPGVRDLLIFYARSDDRIKVVFSKENTGISDSCRRASSVATGDLLGLLDSGTQLHPTDLLKCAQGIEQNKIVWTANCSKNQE